MPDEVQFGKYKGRPVEDMLADATYMQWLEGQPWFREKYSHILHMRDAEAANRTPVHNRMQARFLEKAFCAAFAKSACGDRIAEMKQFCASLVEKCREELTVEVRNAERQIRRATQHRERVAIQAASGGDDEVAFFDFPQAEVLQAARDSLAERLSTLTESCLAYDSFCEFEVEGADVVVIHEVSNKVASIGGKMCQVRLPVEIKPTVADEYPAVLRQMQRHRTRYLLVGRYLGEGATQAQFVEIFKRSGITVVFLDDVEAFL